jgi:hypothetical protein
MLPGHQAPDLSAPATESATNDPPVEFESVSMVDAPRPFVIRLFVSKQQRFELSVRRSVPRRQRPDGSALKVKWNQYGGKRMHISE